MRGCIANINTILIPFSMERYFKQNLKRASADVSVMYKVILFL